MLNREQELLLELLIEKYRALLIEKDIKEITSVKKPKTRSKAQLSRKRWTQDDLRVLALMHSEGKSQTVIARRLRRSKTAVQTMTSHMFGDNKKQVPIVKEFWKRYGETSQPKLI